MYSGRVRRTSLVFVTGDENVVLFQEAGQELAAQRAEEDAAGSDDDGQKGPEGSVGWRCWRAVAVRYCQLGGQ